MPRTSFRRIVRLVDSAKWPYHGRKPLPEDCEGWPNWKLWRGKLIGILANPVGADKGWTCGTKIVYEVCQGTIDRVAPKHSRDLRYYVCPHQVQLGDSDEN